MTVPFTPRCAATLLSVRLTATAFGAERAEHVRENGGAMGWRLPDDDIAAIDRAFPAPDHDVPLGMI
jgi:aryl-alcohol dehydrogenase-like predicted oxidoreductase